jgi:hypothetical protein
VFAAVDPFAGTGRTLPSDARKFLDRIQQFHPHHTDGIAGAKDGTHIVWIVDILQDHSQARQPTSENIGDADLPAGTRKQDVLPV